MYFGHSAARYAAVPFQIVPLWFSSTSAARMMLLAEF
jgi:hypothetical protein